MCRQTTIMTTIQDEDEDEDALTIAYMYGVRDAIKRIKLLEQRIIDLQGHDDLSHIDRKLSEPVAWMFQHEETGLTDCVDAQQVESGYEKNNPRWQKICPLYTAPPISDYHEGWEEGFKAAKREWVGLTDDEVEEVFRFPFHYRSFYKAVEAKLKEKNGG